ncbi:hypothetical protein, partial [Flavobacterium suncheonense]|uniref:hypothetical protein n=1 Tax=Flavobacterium suncheonense TaxID=350894 RepID=UPI003FA3D6BB
NSRHSAWKADALPTELLPHFQSPTLNKELNDFIFVGANIKKYFCFKQILSRKNISFSKATFRKF